MSKNSVLEAFESAGEKHIRIKRVDEHIFMKFNAKENNFWSPQLHLEIEEVDERNSSLLGVFGPNPVLWTFFMFLHFGVAILFMVFGIWAYSNASLNKSYHLQLGLLIFSVFVWFALYAFGRVGRHKGKPQMRELYNKMTDILSSSSV